MVKWTKLSLRFFDIQVAPSPLRGECLKYKYLNLKYGIKGKRVKDKIIF